MGSVRSEALAGVRALSSTCRGPGTQRVRHRGGLGRPCRQSPGAPAFGRLCPRSVQLSLQTEMVVRCQSVSGYYISQFTSVKPSLHPWDITSMATVLVLLHAFLNLICRLLRTFVSVYQESRSAALCCCCILTWFWYQG